MQPTHQPYAIIEKDGAFTRYDGHLYKFASLQGLQDFYEEQASAIVFLNPFRTIRERGFEAHGDEPILAIKVTQITALTRQQVEDALSNKKIIFERAIVPMIQDADFAEIVSVIQDTEIGGGNICQMILSEPYVGKIQDFSHLDAESAFRNCLEQKGQYMTVLMTDGEENFFVSLTPEQHLKIDGTVVTMNPIAGTMPKGDILDLKERLLAFLENPKEMKELFHVLDEELKMMEAICTDGGIVEGPFLRQNGAVIHTEYRIVGNRPTDQNPLAALRETLHAPTLVGGPIGSAARLIAQYEQHPRRYYGGEIGILSPDSELDTAILIRTAHFESDGTVTIQAGAGITRDSIPLEEAYEVRLKTAGMQAAFLGKTNTPADVLAILKDSDIRNALRKRNRYLSKFHLQDQSNMKACESLIGKTAILIDNEDNFSVTLARMMTRMGMRVEVVSISDFSIMENASDIIVIGPGPGDVNDMKDIRMSTLARCTRALMADKRNILGICLGYQSIARTMGFEVIKLDKPTQGESIMVHYQGRDQNLGFYNSFCPVMNEKGVSGNSCEFTMPYLQLGNIGGFQFHPESIMSENGFEILRDELIRIITHR